MIQYIFFISLFLMPALYAVEGCMENSYHADPCMRYDYKNYHYVRCTCRCDTYVHLLDRGMCRACGHFGKRDFHIAYVTKNSKLDHVYEAKRESRCRD